MKTILVRHSALSLVCLFVSFSSLRAEEKSKSDAPAWVLKRFDKNKDGVLDANEKAAYEKAKAAKQEKEMAQRKEALSKYDSNKDGKLSEEERAAAKIEMEKSRSEMEAERMKAKSEERADKESKAERVVSEEKKAEPSK